MNPSLLLCIKKKKHIIKSWMNKKPVWLVPVLLSFVTTCVFSTLGIITLLNGSSDAALWMFLLVRSCWSSCEYDNTCVTTAWLLCISVYYIILFFKKVTLWTVDYHVPQQLFLFFFVISSVLFHYTTSDTTGTVLVPSLEPNYGTSGSSFSTIVNIKRVPKGKQERKFKGCQLLFQIYWRRSPNSSTSSFNNPTIWRAWQWDQGNVMVPRVSLEYFMSN
jgi:hypothetical protein